MNNISKQIELLFFIIALISITGCNNLLSDSSKTESKLNAVYIDPSVSVSGNGSEVSPYKTWAEVNFQPGYSYLQKRGTVARESIILNASGTASEPIIIGAYGAGAAPIIQGSEVETGWVHSGTDAIYQKAIALESGQGLGMATENGSVLTWYEWNTNVATTFTGASAGSYSYDPDSNTSYVWSTDDGSPDTKVIEVSRRYFGVRGVNVSHIQVENIHVRYASMHGISFENAKHIAIGSCTVEKLGGAVIAPGPLYGGNGIEFGNSSAHGSVNNCVISDIFDTGVSPQTYSSNQHASNFLLSNLTISRSGFAGVEIAVLYNGGMANSSISDVIVRGVTVTDSGKGWSGRRYGMEGRGIKIKADLVNGDANTRSISGVIVEDCTVSGSAGEGIFVGGNAGTVTVRRCTVRDNDHAGILAQEIEATTLLLDIYSSVIRNNGVPENQAGFQYNVPSGQGLRVRHTTFYDNQLTGLYISAHNGEAVLMNNIFHASTGRAHFLTGDELDAATSVIVNNLFTEFVPATPIISYTGTPYDTVAAFESGKDFAHGGIGTTNPLLNGALTIQGPTSPAHLAGATAAGITADRNGNPFSSPPSIGAFEY